MVVVLLGLLKFFVVFLRGCHVDTTGRGRGPRTKSMKTKERTLGESLNGWSGILGAVLHLQVRPFVRMCRSVGQLVGGGVVICLS